ncbi:MAG: ATP-binding protein, partial [Candidatus Woesearchaeota archaeon]|nr:ATP-binding protein [Candidatus Woesearchaeota archaeon]
PRIVEEGFLDKIITLNGDFDISLHIEPFPIETMMITLNSELQKQRADLYAMEKKDIISPALEIQYKDTRNVLENLQKGNEKLFNLSFYITCKSDTLEGLNTLTKKAESELNSMLLIPQKPLFLSHKGIISTIPLANNKLGIRRNVTTNALSAFFPFTSQFLQIDETGIWLGLNKNNIPIIKDIFKLYNANGVILASSGGGKSYFTKLMISRLLLNGTKVMVIDPQSEYTDLVNKFNGELITISRTSETIINPLDLMGHDYDEKKLTLFDLFPVMLGQTSEIQKAVLDRALTAVYEAKGITNDKGTWRREPPIIGDLLHQLITMSKDATLVEKETYRSLINRIEMYANGVFSFLNKQTNLNFENRFVCFNIGDMPNQVKPAIMFLILDYVYMKMKKDIERKILVIDEAWSLLERTEDESYIFKIVKTCRKFNLGLLLITQDVGDLLKNDAGKALLNNSEYTLLLRQKPSIIADVEKTFQLSQKEKERLLTAMAGEGILIISNEHTEIKVVASPEEHKVITTNADERLQNERGNANEIVTEFEKTTLDYSKGIFRKAELKKEEVEELLKMGYVLSSHIGLYGGRREEYLLKPRYNETPEHFFVIKIIEEYVRQYTNKVEIFVSTSPDVVFEYNGKKVAIEVETGDKYENAMKKLLFKIEHMNRTYGDDWFFVVTDWSYKKKYQKLGRVYVR